jgi:hypothetical protein
MLGDRGRDPGRAAALERGAVGSGDDDDRARQACRAEVVVDEFVDFATALADQRDHVDVGFAAAREHAEQGALAAAGHREDADALAFACGHDGIDRAYAGRERLVDQLARQRIGRGGIDRHFHHRTEDRAEAVDRLAVRIEDAAEQAIAGTHAGLAPGRDHLGGRGDAVERA